MKNIQKRYIVFAVMSVAVTVYSHEVTYKIPSRPFPATTCIEGGIKGAMIAGVGAVAFMAACIVCSEGKIAALKNSCWYPFYLTTGIGFAAVGAIIGSCVSYAKSFEVSYNNLADALNSIDMREYIFKSTEDEAEFLKSVERYFVGSLWSFAEAFDYMENMSTRLIKRREELLKFAEQDLLGKDLEDTKVLINKAEILLPKLKKGMEIIKNVRDFPLQWRLFKKDQELKRREEAVLAREAAFGVRYY